MELGYLIFNILAYGVSALIILYLIWLTLVYFREWMEDKTNIGALTGVVIIGLLSIGLLSLYIWALL